MSTFKRGQKVRYIGPDTAAAPLHGDVLLISDVLLGGKVRTEIVASSQPSRVGQVGTTWARTLEPLPAGGVMSPEAFRDLGRERVHPDPLFDPDNLR